MAKEIERKFLVRNDSWRAGARHFACRQGYLHAGERGSVRVRIVESEAFLTVKGKTVGISRDEFEYSIPLPDAELMLAGLCEGGIIEKTRFLVPLGQHTWEVDVFAGDNAGLVVAEVELSDEAEALVLPDWVGEEVSHDPRYRNAYLSRCPYTTWPHMGN